MWKLKEFFVIFLMVPLLIQGITNKKEQIESQLKKPFDENRISDKFVLIGHSDSPALEGANDGKLRTRKFYQARDQYYQKKYNLMDENSRESETEVEDGVTNLTYLNPRSGYAYGGGLYAARPGFLGGNHGNAFSLGHGFSGGLAGLGGSGLSGLGLGSLHLLDPLLLLATLSFVLFLVNSVITLVERLRLPTLPVVAGRREFLARDDWENNSTHITQEIFNDMEQFFHNLIEDYESKYKNNTQTQS